jgi:lipoate-protein ligase A
MANNWCIYPLLVADQQRHIDQSEKLLSSIQPGDAPILYWNVAEPCGLVLGFSQRAAFLNQVNQAALEKFALPVYQRRAGGTAVLVGPHLLSLDVILPAGHPLILHDIVESYRWFGEAWMTTLEQLGISTRLVPPVEAHALRDRLKQPEIAESERLLNRACYGTLSSYEVVAGQRKVVGFDMIRRRNGSLLQAGVLLHWETDMLAQLLGHTPEEQQFLREALYERAVGIDTLARRVITTDEIIKAFNQTISRIMPVA